MLQWSLDWLSVWFWFVIVWLCVCMCACVRLDSCVDAMAWQCMCACPCNMHVHARLVVSSPVCVCVWMCALQVCMQREWHCDGAGWTWMMTWSPWEAQQWVSLPSTLWSWDGCGKQDHRIISLYHHVLDMQEEYICKHSCMSGSCAEGGGHWTLRGIIVCESELSLNIPLTVCWVDRS